ncbi:MAG: hypothetical protein HOQ37_16360 [Cupriavidus sp.]|nr:hypothetical protein [Cupriavidus sp.]
MNITVEPQPWTPERIEEVRQAFEGHKSWTAPGLVEVTEYVQQGVFNRITVDAEPVGFYVLFAWKHRGTVEAEISHVHVRTEFDAVRHILPVIERQCAEADALTVTTRRRGLIKKLQQQGYAIEGVILRKRGKKRDSAA